jgi:hypothetical protein
MISAHVQTYDNGGNTEEFVFDAEPWFEQASQDQLAALSRERQGQHGRGRWAFYTGDTTDEIWLWYAKAFKHVPSVDAFSRECKDSDAGWSCAIDDARDVDRWLLLKKTRTAATSAVDALLGP